MTHVDQFESVSLTELGLFLIALDQFPIGGLSAKEIERLKMLPPHVFDSQVNSRDVDIEMLWFQPSRTSVLNNVDALELPPHELKQLVFTDPGR